MHHEHPGSQVIGNTETLKALIGAIRGRAIMPDHGDYNAARELFFSSLSRRPAVIIKAADTSDITRVVNHAREHGAELAIRCGGHSLAGHGMSEGGIVLDLAALDSMEIDVAGRFAWAGAGMTAGKYTNAAAAHGLATGFGDSGTVGIGGITLGGGVGYLVRKYGMTIDDLLAAEIVTADGRSRTIDESNDPDLFWAIRGGGGNFGVVTRFKFRLHEVDRVLGGVMFLPGSPDVLRSFIEAAEDAPDEFSVIVNVMRAPPMPFIPSEHHGRIILMASMVFAGPISEGERVVASLRKLATPIVDMVRPMRYPEMYQNEMPHTAAISFRSLFVDRVDQEMAAAVFEHLRTARAPIAMAQFRVLGGAMARLPSGATAFAHRTRGHIASAVALYERREDTPAHDAWVTELAGSLRNGDSNVYVNFLSDEGPARVRDAYPGAVWDRLRAIKRIYDPANVFRVNHNIPPEMNGRAQ